jgi:hypothetical protein
VVGLGRALYIYKILWVEMLTFKRACSRQRGLWLPLTLPVWKARVSFNLLLNKKEKKSLSLRLFDVEPENAPAELLDRQMAHMTKNEEEKAEEEDA